MFGLIILICRLLLWLVNISRCLGVVCAPKLIIERFTWFIIPVSDTEGGWNCWLCPEMNTLTFHKLTQEHINGGMSVLLLRVFSFWKGTVLVKTSWLKQIIKYYLLYKASQNLPHVLSSLEVLTELASVGYVGTKIKVRVFFHSGGSFMSCYNLGSHEGSYLTPNHFLFLISRSVPTVWVGGNIKFCREIWLAFWPFKMV